VGSLTAGTQIHFRGYATNSAGDGYTPTDGTVYTEPANQPNTLGFSAITANSMTITWSDPGGATGSEGAIVVMKQGSDPNVGDEVPVITGSTSGSNNDNPFTTVERKEVGIKLKVTPQINEGNAVQLEIEQEVSNVNGRTAVDVTFGKRTLTTTVLADSGETVVLGGLLNEDVQESVSKVPLLGDIPVIGHLFSSTSSKKTKRNLMIFIKPTIIRDGPSMTGIAGRKYNYFRAQQLEQAERGINLMPNTDVPVLDEWVVPDGMSPEIHDILMRHQSGQSMSTPIRDQNEWMQKALDGSAQPGDNATDAKEQPVEEKQND